MRIVSFEKSGKAALGVRDGDEVIDLSIAAPTLPSDLKSILAFGEEGLRAVRKAADRAPASARIPLAGITHLVPIADPGKIFCVGLNYIDHVSESPYKDVPKYPVIFGRYANSLVAHNRPLIRPHVSKDFDFECELVAIIGKQGRYIPQANALDYVAGYSVFNDGSLRDYQFFSHQWLVGKNFDGTGGFGPEFVTADELPPGAKGLQIQTRLNGEVMQKANTSDMIFDVARLVSTISEVVTLNPGDLIVTGTPSGVGFARKPQVFMKAGDVCEIEIDGVGILRNPITDEA